MPRGGGGGGLRGARAGGLEEEAGRWVGGAAWLLADGAGELLLPARAVLQPLLQTEGVEDVAAGGEAVEVLVGERAEVLVADGADRPCGGAGHGGVVVVGGGGIRRMRTVASSSSSCGWIWERRGKEAARA